MYRNIEDFIQNWSYESEATLKVFRNLTEKAADLQANENVRTLKELAWHITGAVADMMREAGIVIDAPDEERPAPDKISEIIAIYEKAANAVKTELPQKWTNADLPAEIEVYGQTWRKGDLLSALISHQTHHRAQMTVLMRFAGLKVPGVYGPSKEEWEAFKKTSSD